MFTHPLTYTASRQRNAKKYGSVNYQCVICLKPMKEGETKRVHMNEDWLMVRKDVPVEQCKELTGSNSQGFFEIGNGCAKKYPKDFIFDVGDY